MSSVEPVSVFQRQLALCPIVHCVTHWEIVMSVTVALVWMESVDVSCCYHVQLLIVLFVILLDSVRLAMLDTLLMPLDYASYSQLVH